MVIKNLKLIIFFILLISFFSCSRNEVYFKYQQVPKSGWHKDSLLSFDFKTDNKNDLYDVYLHLRHDEKYLYQNMWLLLTVKNRENVLQNDTLEIKLSDQFGKRIGVGKSIKEITTLHEQNIAFSDSGFYHLDVKHGMSDSLLQGIKEIGIRIEKVVE